MKEFLITDINYDTQDKTGLPVKIRVIVPSCVSDPQEINEYISDDISNQTGFCHKGFSTTPEINGYN